MIQELESAALNSRDPPDYAPLNLTTSTPSSTVGRPRITIDEDFLATALRLRGPTHIAPVLNCSARTVRR